MTTEKREEAAGGTKRYREGADLALYCIARQFGVESRDIRKSKVSVEKKAAVLAERIRQEMEEKK